MSAGSEGMDEERTPAYLKVARFGSVEAMQAASAEVVALLHAHIGDGRNLSSYGIEVDRVPYVVVLGERPKIVLEGKLAALAAGTPDSLPPNVVARLMGERHKVHERGPWVHEQHKPGREVT